MKDQRDFYQIWEKKIHSCKFSYIATILGWGPYVMKIISISGVNYTDALGVTVHIISNHVL